MTDGLQGATTWRSIEIENLAYARRLHPIPIALIITTSVINPSPSFINITTVYR
ncbi:hypothetical protein [Chloroflexus sp.]|uniref:hypothetical protein n=1 Tax=Chloroflexus sp. TaxID=1904827 RepID=UPI002613AAB0|nr:hypothetical protein [uncultured Chloroflexus sp.]